MRLAALGVDLVAQKRRVDRRRDDGQVVLLVIGFALIVITLIGVVVDASTAFLYRRALVAAVDGAVTAAVQAVDASAIYGDPDALAGGALPLDESGARIAVEDYLADQGLGTRFQDLTIRSVEVSADGRTITVILSATVDLPFTRLMSSRLQNVTITAAAAAHAPTG